MQEVKKSTRPSRQRPRRAQERPADTPEIKNVRLELPFELHKAIKIRAAEAGQTMGEWMLEALRLQAQKTGTRL
jgi:predicted HicB family RNase H-like nuclease